MKAYAIFSSDGNPYYFTGHFPDGISDGKAQAWPTAGLANAKLSQFRATCTDATWSADLTVKAIEITPEQYDQFTSLPKTLPDCYRFIWVRNPQFSHANQ